MSASESDAINAYVAEGLGIAVVPTLALDSADAGLHAVDVTHLFPKSVMIISLRRDFHLRRHLTDFIQMLVPRLSREAVHRMMNTGDTGCAR